MIIIKQDVIYVVFNNIIVDIVKYIIAYVIQRKYVVNVLMPNVKINVQNFLKYVLVVKNIYVVIVGLKKDI